jgi:ribonuclease Z
MRPVLARPRYPRAVDLSLFFAGTGGSVPTARRGLPALLVRRGGEHLLFDCGEGTQRQLVRSVGLPEIDTVFLTHFHADHWLGLPGMLKSFDLRERQAPLTVFGPPGTVRLLDQLRFVYGKLGYPLAIEELESGEAVYGKGYEVQAFNVRHRGTAFGYAIVEDPRPGRFDADLATELGVPFGPEFGQLQAGETVRGVRPEQVMGPERPGRRIVISGDTAPCEMVEVAADGADVLVHEATFVDADRARAAETGHTTARQAAELAAAANVRLLAMTHISTRYVYERDGSHPSLDEAQATFADTVLPRDFDEIAVPFPERGAPELLRWSDRRAAARAEAQAS